MNKLHSHRVINWRQTHLHMDEHFDYFTSLVHNIDIYISQEPAN